VARAVGTGSASRAVVLHAGDGLPVRSVPSVWVTAVGTSPIAVSNLVLTRGRSVEGREAAVTQTRL